MLSILSSLVWINNNPMNCWSSCLNSWFCFQVSDFWKWLNEFFFQLSFHATVVYCSCPLQWVFLLQLLNTVMNIAIFFCQILNYWESGYLCFNRINLNYNVKLFFWALHSNFFSGTHKTHHDFRLSEIQVQLTLKFHNWWAYFLYTLWPRTRSKVAFTILYCKPGKQI